MKKIGLFSLLAVSACALAGCGKGLSTEEAMKFAEDNFVEEARDGHIVTKGRVNASGYFEKYSQPEDKIEADLPILPENKYGIASMAEFGFKYSTFAGKLYADWDLTYKDIKEEFSFLLALLPEDAVKVNGKESYVYDKQGYEISHDYKLKIDVNYKDIKGSYEIIEGSKITLK